MMLGPVWPQGNLAHIELLPTMSGGRPPLDPEKNKILNSTLTLTTLTNYHLDIETLQMPTANNYLTQGQLLQESASTILALT